MPLPQLPIPHSAAGQRTRFAAAYSVLEQAIAQRAFPGAVFSVLEGDEILAIDGVGSFTYDPASAPVRASTVYDLASVTKVIVTSAMAMLLHQRKKLFLDQPLVEILPAFAQDGDADGERHRVTLRMLLAHASGLPGYVRLFATCPDGDSLFAACLRLPLESRPGTRMEYSDIGFILLGRALEKIAGEGLDRFCARELFAPLGMSSTCFLPPALWRSSIPPTEDDWVFRHRILQGEVQDENCFVLGGISGHAGLFSNAADPLRFVRTLFSAGHASTGSPGAPQLFASETVRLFTTRSELPPGSSRALGWDTPSLPSSSGSFFSRHSAGHLGYAGTSLWADFERKLAVVLLTNRTWPHRESERIRQIRPAFHDAILDALKRAPRND
jgi:serine-type D-Ala-D-Ala carboxypeptidase